MRFQGDSLPFLAIFSLFECVLYIFFFSLYSSLVEKRMVSMVVFLQGGQQGKPVLQSLQNIASKNMYCTPLEVAPQHKYG